MFIEPHIQGERRGWIEVICGSMFSGKTEELIRRLKRARIANLKVKIFKASVDKRYHEEEIVSHDENSILSTPVDFSDDILLSEDVDVIGIDEAQFFDDNIIAVCNHFSHQCDEHFYFFEKKKRKWVCLEESDLLTNLFQRISLISKE